PELSTLSLHDALPIFAEALAAELRLAAQRLLGNERVGAGGTGMHLVVDQVMQLEIVHVADGDRTLELLAGTAVEQPGLRTGRREDRKSTRLNSSHVKI